MARRQAVIRIDWEGAGVVRAVGRQDERGLAAMAETVYAAARANVAGAVRNRTGRLARSGYWATARQSTYSKTMRGQKRARRPREGAAVIAWSAPHSHLIENGTRHMAARPYVRPAIEETAGRLAQVYAGAVRRRLEAGP